MTLYTSHLSPPKGSPLAWIRSSSEPLRFHACTDISTDLTSYVPAKTLGMRRSGWRKGAGDVVVHFMPLKEWKVGLLSAV